MLVDIGGQEVVAAITRSSVERLGLQQGDQVAVVSKATEVMLAKWPVRSRPEESARTYVARKMVMLATA